jgi:hypothetical protein
MACMAAFSSGASIMLAGGVCTCGAHQDKPWWQHSRMSEVCWEGLQPTLFDHILQGVERFRLPAWQQLVDGACVCSLETSMQYCHCHCC